MNTVKKLLCLLLVLVMCLTVFAGCQDPETPDNPDDTGESESNDDTNDTDDTDGTDDTDDTGETEESTTIPEDIKTNLKDNYSFGEGTQSYRILSRASTKDEFDATAGITGSAVSTAIYTRNEEVMERCDVEITIEPIAGDWDDRESFMQRVRNDGALTTSEFELIATHAAYLANLAVEGLGWDFTELPNIDLSKRWWSETFYNECNFKGSQYFAYGDIAYTLYSYMMVVFFNTTLADNLQIAEDLYDLALEGDWTFAKMKEYIVRIDANTDGAAEENLRYGWLTNEHAVRNMSTAFNIDYATVGAEGKREIPKQIPASISDPLNELVNFVKDTEQVYLSKVDYLGAGDCNEIFSSGRALFYTQTLGTAVTFKATMQDDYGVLPFPKYSAETQDTYRAGFCDELTAVMVPYGVENPELAGTVTEMLCELSYFMVTDSYYEDTLKYQSFNNPKCVKSLELIRASISPTFAMIYSNSLNFIFSFPTSVLANSTYSIDTYWRDNVNTWRTNLRVLYAALEALEAARQESAA